MTIPFGANYSDCLRQCYISARLSDDPRTKNAAIIADLDFDDPGGPWLTADDNAALGTNGFPLGVKQEASRWERPEKHRRVIHAEAMAICTCAWYGIPTKGTTMFACWAACAECAKLIIEAGIIRVVTHQPEGFDEHGLPLEGEDTGHSRWLDSILLANEMFAEACVEKVVVKGRLFEPGSFQIMRSGILIEP